MTFRAAGATDVGVQRVVNEDRYLVDAEHGIFVVVDGVGGQAAGGRAADTALDVVREKLTASNGAVASRLRDAITTANNEVHRQASSRAEWNGMACVLTAAVIDGNRAVIGHVGDTRLYKLRAGTIQKLTSDHSPVGEREDAGDLSEFDAMHHPRRNEVYRDVGSEPHTNVDADFVDIREIPLEPDAALLLCSDGLTDLVSSGEIQQIVRSAAGEPDRVARSLVQAANQAGGKDNITVVYVEGAEFGKRTRRGRGTRSGGNGGFWLPVALIVTLMAALTLAWWKAGDMVTDAIATAIVSAQSGADVVTVGPGQSIAAALASAAPGATILVEPGEYREQLSPTGRVRLISTVSRGATLRLPGTATDADAAIAISDASAVEISGFRIVGDAATPLGTGVITRSANVRLIDLEVIGAARVAVDLGPGANLLLASSDIHDNPGPALAVRTGASARIAHNTFAANGGSAQATAVLVVEPGSRPDFAGNVFRHLDPRLLTSLDAAVRAQVTAGNWFPDAPRTGGPTTGPGRSGQAPAAGRGRQ
jgi:serine/threonine protein phosphatase PrpC